MRFQKTKADVENQRNKTKDLKAHSLVNELEKL